MDKIEKIALFYNEDSYSKKIYDELQKKIKEYGYVVNNTDFDLGIAIGGDGSFLRMLKETAFNDQVYYIGVNTGTLGFAQEIYPDEIDWFLRMLKDNNYKVENISVQETKVLCEEKEDNLYKICVNSNIYINPPYSDIISWVNFIEKKLII